MPKRNGGESSDEQARRARTVRGVPTVVALFSGAGGLDLGFKQAGFRVLLATDIDPAAAKTHARNWPKAPFICKDVRELSVVEILEATKERRPDVLIGGPPCEGFSTLGVRQSADPRNILVDAFIRIAEGLQPQAIVLENVRAIATEYRGRFRDYIIRRFEGIGYHTHFSVLDAASYGVPQNRRRAFFVGFADPRVTYEFPSPTHGEELKPFATVGQAIDDLTRRGPRVPNHVALNHSEKVISRYRLIPEGGMLPPPDLLPKAIRRSNFGSTYKRLHRRRPSLTIVPGNNAFPVHPVLDRSLTPREAARLQSFPDDYVFEGDRRRQCILVGHAVPPALARVIAVSIRERIHASKERATAVVSPSAMSILTSKRRSLASDAPNDAPGFVDLFSGAGGFTLGLIRAGLRPLLCVDVSKHVRETHVHNYSDVPFVHGDLGLPKIQQEVTNGVGEAPFLVVGGPPCQGFSIFGKRRLKDSEARDARLDPRNRLVFSFIDTVGRLKPRWVVMENVPGFVTLDGGSFVEAVVQELRALGYVAIESRVLDAADYGVPQRRKRFVLIANRTGHIIPWPKRKFFESPKDWQNPYRTVGEAIGDLADESSFSRVSCHVPMKHKPLQVERFKRIPEGGRLDVESLPKELRRGYRTKEVKNFSHVFKRLDRARPSMTLVPGHNAFPIHPWLPRALTVREAARLQTFPDELECRGSREDQCVQVGNAFPPLLAELIANNICKAESSNWLPGIIPALAAYSLLEMDDRLPFPLGALNRTRIVGDRVR